MSRPIAPLALRFWPKIKYAKPSECWHWTGAKDRHGYGLVMIDPITLRQARAHRIAVQLTYGDFDPALKVLHSCDTPSCVNPNHLFLGTQAENVADMDAKGRRVAKGPAPENRKYKLHPEQVEEMRRLHATQGLNFTALARIFNISKTTAMRICRRINWK